MKSVDVYIDIDRDSRVNNSKTNKLTWYENAIGWSVLFTGSAFVCWALLKLLKLFVGLGLWIYYFLT